MFTSESRLVQWLAILMEAQTVSFISWLNGTVSAVEELTRHLRCWDRRRSSFLVSWSFSISSVFIHFHTLISDRALGNLEIYHWDSCLLTQHFDMFPHCCLRECICFLSTQLIHTLFRRH